MTTTPNEEFTAFKREDIVYDDDCVECGGNTSEKLSYVNREDPESVIHETCYYNLIPRFRADYIAIKDVPSGKPTAAEKVDAMVGESLDADEYDIDEPVSVELGD